MPTIENPYAPPEAEQPQGNPLKIPAIFLLVVAGLFLLLWLVAAPMMINNMQSLDASTPAGAGNLVGQIVTFFGLATSNVVVVIGSIAMLRRRNLTLAKSAAIAACIPICSPFYVLGIPFGIWALRLLGKPEIQSEFKAER